jgi:outer membrane protein assembly factor BamB
MRRLAKTLLVVTVVVLLATGFVWWRSQGHHQPVAQVYAVRSLDGDFEVTPASGGGCWPEYRSQVMALDPDTGSVQWSRAIPWAHRDEAVVAVDAERAVIRYDGTGQPNGLLAVGTDGTPLWQVDVPGFTFDARRAPDGSIAVSSQVSIDRIFRDVDRSVLSAVDPATGALVWTTDVTQLRYEPMTIVGGTVIVSDDGGTARGYSMEDGSLLWEVDMTAAPFTGVERHDDIAVLALPDEDSLAVVSGDGEVVARIAATKSPSEVLGIQGSVAVYRGYKGHG